MEPQVISFIHTGTRGKSGQTGKDGYAHGEGWNGYHGEKGGQGGALFLSLDTTDHMIKIEGKFETDIQTHVIPFDSNSSILVDVSGGQGGSGGKGGKGDVGKKGAAGTDANEYHIATSGERGGTGGRGGPGGPGGTGGDGGSVTISVSENDMDLLMLFRPPPNLSGGEGGKGGAGGPGGPGGPGGAGGSGCSYTVTNSGQVRGGGGNYSHTAHRSAGRDGQKGLEGQDGMDGNDGGKGKNGRMDILIARAGGQTAKYTSIYDLTVNVETIKDTYGYGVLEPGSEAEVTVSHKNESDMPTPNKQKILYFLKQNEWVLSEEESGGVYLRPWILGGRQETISKPIKIRIKDISEPSLDKPFLARGQLEHHAVMQRIEKEFKRMDPSPIQIMHPVDISPFKGGNVAQYNKELPLSFEIFNEAFISIGEKAEVPRALHVVVRVLPQTTTGAEIPYNAIILKHEGKETRNYVQGLLAEIPLLEVGDQQKFEISVKFEKDLPLYSSVKIEAQLFLGHVKELLIPRLIQTQQFEIQLSEVYTWKRDADTLLVINSQTPAQDIEPVTKCIQELGNEYCIWNMDMYGGLNLSAPLPNGSTLQDDFQFGTIVFFDNQLADKKFSLDLIPQHTFFAAARDFGIGTLIIKPADHAYDLAKEVTFIDRSDLNRVFVTSRNVLLELLTSSKGGLIGKGRVKPFPADSASTLCGCFKVSHGDHEGKVFWCTYHANERIICFYKSANQLYPDGTIPLPENPRLSSKIPKQLEIQSATGEVFCLFEDAQLTKKN